MRSISDWLASPAVVRKHYPAAPASGLALPECRRIIVIKLDEIGDFVLATPFFRELRRNCPDADITLVVRPSLLPLATACPHFNHVLVYDGQTRGLSQWQWKRQSRARKLARSHLRNPTADVAIIPRWGEDAYNATNLAAYSRPRAIIAYSELSTSAKQQMNAGIDQLVSHVVPPGSFRHEVRHNLALLERFGGKVESEELEIQLPEAARTTAGRILPRNTRFVAFGCGALDPRRRWPVDRFERVGRHLRERFNLSGVILGAGTDPAYGGAVDLTGKTTLLEAAAILERCVLFVGNDSGLKHLAAAVRVPVVEVSGFRAGGDPNDGNSPDRFHAWGVNQRVVQPPPGTGGLAIAEVAADQVEQACEAILAAPARVPR